MRILIIGLGSIAKKHIAAIRKLNPKAEIFALRSSKKTEVIEDVRQIFDWSELTFKPDFIIISNPTYLHGETIIKSLDYECPLFIEKPVLNVLENADSIIAEVRSRKVITYVACNLRFHPSIRFLKDYLQARNPRINEVNVYCGSYLPQWRPVDDFRTSYSANADMGGGVHLDLIHELDYSFWIFGKPDEIVSIKRNVSSLNIDAIDYAHFNLFYPMFSLSINLNYYRRDPKRELEVVMDEDTLSVDLLKNRVESRITGKVLFENPFHMSQTYSDQMKYFTDKIQQKTQPMNSIDEGIAMLSMVLKSGRT